MLTFIETDQVERKTLGEGLGEAAEIVGPEICGASEVRGVLRWLGPGERIEAAPLPDAHQLLYLMEGQGVIELKGKAHEVGAGGGIYLGPGEGAQVRQAGAGKLKVFHVTVPPA